MPKTAESFVNFLGPISKVLEGLPIVTRRLENYHKINCPILITIGDGNEYTGISILETIELMKKENRLTEAYQIKNCNHDFEGKEEELTNIVRKFLVKNFKK